MNIRNLVQNLFGRGVVVRIAPSPTGPFHVGTARSALFNFLFAQKYGGKFIVRIEDTDRQRSKKSFEKDILDGLLWLNIREDSLYRQSERVDIHRKYLKRLIDKGKAYLSEEESKGEKNKRVEVVRLRNPGKKITFIDLIRGPIEFDTTELGDFVLAKNLDEPLYHLAVVVDDATMGITHIIRGEDHISNTPRQILIQEALGFKRPHYAHLPLILAADRSKLSKRFGATSMSDFRRAGYLPEAIINYLALLGWNPGTEQEIFTLKELIHAFDLSGIQKGGAVFDIEKLNWFNREYIKQLPKKQLLEKLDQSLSERIKQLEGYSLASVERMAPIIIEHIHTFSDINQLERAGELDYFFIRPEYKSEKLLWKEKGDLQTIEQHLKTLIKQLQNISPSSFTEEHIKQAVWDYASQKGRGEVLWPMRYVLSGKDKSPSPFQLAEALGKEETIARLHNAVQRIAV